MVAFDVIEDILLRSDANDLLRCKSVCKSWYSLISTPVFVKAHLKKKTACSNNNDSTKDEHIRIVMPSFWKNKSLYQLNQWKLVGSSNGLVCVSRLLQDGLILVNNPWTREVRKLPIAPRYPVKLFGVVDYVCLSFGYDASTDDYKVVLGIKINDRQTLIQVLSLKSNTWKIIGQFNFVFCYNHPGILFNGAFFWSAYDFNHHKTKRVIVSFDLSREVLTIIPQPKDSKYLRMISLGIVENQLCIYFPDDNNDLPRAIWAIRSSNVEHSWERLPNHPEIKYMVLHSMKMLEFSSPNHKRINFFCVDDKCLSKAWKYITAPIFIPTLVSPYVNSARPSHPTNDMTILNAWSIEVPKGECRHTQGKIGNFFKASEKTEKTYRMEVGEAENLYLHEDGK